MPVQCRVKTPEHLAPVELQSLMALPLDHPLKRHHRLEVMRVREDIKGCDVS